MVRPLIVAAVWVGAALLVLLTLMVSHWWLLAAVPVTLLAALGVWDLVQTRHAILRSYPDHRARRFLLESIRPEIQQYFVESNTDGTPFDRETRDMVYERAKGTKGDEPFGTERDVNALGYEFLQPFPARAVRRRSGAHASGSAVRTARSRTTLRCSTFRR